jgi:signal transduction histidine kinase
MTNTALLEQLKSADLHVRLQAARILAQAATSDDANELEERLTGESVVWIRTALLQAIDRARPRAAPTEPEVPRLEHIVPLEVFEQIRTIAINDTTKRIVHELSPILGAVILYAENEIPSFDASKTKRQLDRLHQMMRAIDRLSRAAVAPSLQEFELASVIDKVVEAEQLNRRVKIQKAGATPLLAIGDPTLVEIVISNAIRNAVEAVETLYPNGEVPPVVVTWGDSDSEIWVGVLDKGRGPPTSLQGAFEIGRTTKKDHLGMGLAIARQAAQSLSGTVDLSPRAEGGGTLFEFKWPKTTLTPNESSTRRG